MVLDDDALSEWVRQHGYVELRWAREDDDVNRITVAAMSQTRFGGRGQGWINEEPVRTFAKRLGDYPLNESDPPTLVVGSHRLGEPLHTQVSLRVYPIGSRGQLGIQVHLATEPWQAPPMRAEEYESVALEVRTTYQRLEDFGRDLRDVLDGHDTIARIDGEHLA